MAFKTLHTNTIEKRAPYRNCYAEWPSNIPLTNIDLVEALKDTSLRREFYFLEGKIDLVTAVPPRQNFSVSGYQNGNYECHNLIDAMLDFIALIKPNCILIENVESILQKLISKPSQGKISIAQIVVEKLENMGYSAVSESVNAADFGVPQDRRRAVIVGIKKNNN